MENKTYKVNLAWCLLLCCIGMAVFNVYSIRGDIQDYLQEEQDLKDNVYPNNEITNTQDQPELPLFYQSLWKVLNIVWYLFLGGMIYANIRINDKK